MRLDFILHNNGQIIINKDHLTFSKNCSLVSIILNLKPKILESKKKLEDCKCSGDKGNCSCKVLKIEENSLTIWKKVLRI